MTWLKPFLIDGSKVQMTPAQRDIFAILFNKKGGIVTRREICNMLWAKVKEPPLHPLSAVLNHITILRRLLLNTRFRIITRKTHGYQMVRI